MVFCLLFLSVFSTLLTTSHSLTCIDCTFIVGLELDIDIPCTGIEINCPSDEVCVSRQSMILKGNESQQARIYTRACGPRDLCSVSASATTPSERIIMSFSCCYTDRCTPRPPVLPSISSEKNGVVCKSCQSKENVPCDSNTYMDCVGGETKCFSQVIKSGSQAEAIRGCSTPSLCKVPNTKGSQGVDTTCTDGGASLHCCLQLLVVTFICLFKVVN